MKISERVDKYFEAEHASIKLKIGGIAYKGLYLTDIISTFTLNRVIDRQDFIDACARCSDVEVIRSSFKSVVERELYPVSGLLKVIKSMLEDMFRFFYFSIKPRKEVNERTTVFFLITNPKFIAYLDPINRQLNTSGVETAHLFWDQNHIPKKFAGTAVTPRSAFPRFWFHNYFRFREYFAICDRLLGFEAMLAGKSLIIPEGCLAAHHIAGRLAKKIDCESYAIQWGFFGRTSAKAGWRNMPYDYLLVWGNFFKYHFSRYNPQLKIKVVGHHLLSPIYSEKIEKQSILFAVQNEMGAHVTSSDISKFIDYAIDFADSNAEVQVIIRGHPDRPLVSRSVQRVEEIRNLSIHNFRTHSLTESMASCKFVVSISSTLALESVAYGCYPVYLEVNSMPLKLHEIFEPSSGHEHVVSPGRFNDFIAKQRNRDLNPYLVSFSNNLFISLGNEASTNICQVLTGGLLES